MELSRIAVRVVFTFVFLLVVVRLSGKRVVSEATTFDFVFALIVGDLVDNAIWAEVPMAQFFVAAGALAMMQLMTGAGTYLWAPLHRLVAGRPSLVMRDGHACESGTRHELLAPPEIERALREQGVARAEWHTVHRMWLETSGEASVFKHYRSRDAQKCDRRRLLSRAPSPPRERRA